MADKALEVELDDTQSIAELGFVSWEIAQAGPQNYKNLNNSFYFEDK